MGKVIVRPEWVTTSMEKFNHDRHFRAHTIQTEFKIQIFSGLRICITGIPQQTRNEVEQLVVSNGGAYHKDLSLECTHLISVDPKSKKHEFAMSNRILVVSEQWIQECIRESARLDESLYQVETLTRNVSSCIAYLGSGFTSDQVNLFRNMMKELGIENPSDYSSSVSHFIISSMTIKLEYA